ncbi:hypothetical protein HJC23_011410 [Cyclotella cryptica]|uniref:Uncharacterized protein n=1 Tax=Cyclotella cryptica TaxID=29204 RepID=A0ABD3PKA8_9STRA|eukprot:CCRYP_013703-RA/>CCRYP_013703-RA protein AED:0.11 eAED:0.11 QI:0/-1/0/1/-1/1/1/0/367
MVQFGKFSLSLIRAETRAMYKEHVSPGGQDIFTIYAEVEPNDEFYLLLRSDAPEVVGVDLRVDGSLIQSGHRLHPGLPSTVGVLPVGNTNKEVALRFASAKVMPDGTLGRGADGACEYWTGEVEATFYGNPNHRVPPGTTPKPSITPKPSKEEQRVETNIPSSPAPSSSIGAPPRAFDAPVSTSSRNTSWNRGFSSSSLSSPSDVRDNFIYSQPTTTFYRNHSLASSDVGYVPGKDRPQPKKGVKSAEGTTELRTHCFAPRSTHRDNKQKHRDPFAPIVKEPEKLGVITLKYCSTVGLIFAGILTKPPNWEVERLQSTCSKRMREEHAMILSKIKIIKFELKSETITGCGEKVVEKREVELLDLTTC